MAQVHGHCEPAFEPIRKLLQDHLDSGVEVGASLYVLKDGKPIIDLWGGHADQAKTKAWDEDTIVNVWSTTKEITALAALILVDRGLLDVNAKVSKYWPEFAANGKQDIEVRHLLSHTAGLAAWQEKMKVEDLFDADLAASRLAAQAPLWEPGTCSGYHAVTYGYPIGELVKRVSGKPLKQFVAEEMAAPLGADFQIGALEKDWARVAEIFDGGLDKAMPPPGTLIHNMATNPGAGPKEANTEAWRRAEIGSVNGHSNAKGVVNMLVPLVQGGRANGHQLLSQDTIDLIFQQQSHGDDLILGPNWRFGIGYALADGGNAFIDSFIPHGKVCFWGGWGGSLGVMDLDRKICIGYVMNAMSGSGVANKAAVAYMQTLYQILEKEGLYDPKPKI